MLLGQFGLVTSSQMFSQWKFVVVGATVAAAVLTPSTDPFTQVRSMIKTVSWLPRPFKTASAVGPLHLASSGLRWPSTTIRMADVHRAYFAWFSAAQTLLAVPLIGLYLGGAAVVRLLESTKTAAGTS